MQEINEKNYNKGLLFEYIKVLEGQASTFSNVYFIKGSEKNHESALQIFRFAIEYFLHWKPEDAEKQLNQDIISKMRLEKVYKYINFPPELDPEKDYWYVAHLLYPSKIRYDMEQLALDIYKKVLLGKDNKGLYKFPKHFFDGADGRLKATVCLHYLIDKYEVFGSVKEMYAYFASDKGRKDLDDHALRLVWRNVFTSPVIYLHETLPAEQRNEFWFHYYEFVFRYQEEEKNEKRMKQLAANLIGYQGGNRNED